jgi:hypothetical protein
VFLFPGITNPVDNLAEMRARFTAPWPAETLADLGPLVERNAPARRYTHIEGKIVSLPIA